MLMFRDPSAEDQFLANDGEALRGLYAGCRAARRRRGGRVRARVHGPAPRSPVASTGTAPTTSAPTIGPITVPTMYVWSTDDIALGREAAEATGRTAQGSYRFEILEDVSHWLPEEAPDQLNALLLSHLSGK